MYTYVRQRHTQHITSSVHTMFASIFVEHTILQWIEKKAKWNVAVACARLKHVRWIIAIPFRMHSQFSNCITFPQLNRSSAFFRLSHAKLALPAYGNFKLRLAYSIFFLSSNCHVQLSFNTLASNGCILFLKFASILLFFQGKKYENICWHRKVHAVHLSML